MNNLRVCLFSCHSVQGKKKLLWPKYSRFFSKTISNTGASRRRRVLKSGIMLVSLADRTTAVRRVAGRSHILISVILLVVTSCLSSTLPVSNGQQPTPICDHNDQTLTGVMKWAIYLFIFATEKSNVHDGLLYKYVKERVQRCQPVRMLVWPLLKEMKGTDTRSRIYITHQPIRVSVAYISQWFRGKLTGFLGAKRDGGLVRWPCCWAAKAYKILVFPVYIICFYFWILLDWSAPTSWYDMRYKELKWRLILKQGRSR
jgi:hypothetical protein